MNAIRMPVPDDRPHQQAVDTAGHDHQPDHIVQFYGDDDAFLDALSHSIVGALRADNSVVAIATISHQAGLAGRLKASGLDLAKAIESRRFIPLDARETLQKFMVDDWPDAGRFGEAMGGVIERAKSAAGDGRAPVFAFGEMVAILWAEGKTESALGLEHLWNNFARQHALTLRCAYPMRAFDREEFKESFLKICTAHSSVIPAENYTGLTDEKQRLRNVSLLQQKAQALENEKAERERAQRSLHSREAELADLLENSLEGIQQIGPDQRIRWANKALLNLLGFSAEEYVGHPFAEFFAHQHVFEEFWEKLMQGGDLYDFAAELICSDGCVKHVLIHCNGLWEDGRLIHTRSFIRDITERREMELALQSAHEELEMRVRERTRELRQKNQQILEQTEVLELTNQGLRDLSARLMRVQDEERRRIARDLHDSTGQSIGLLCMNLSALEAEAHNCSPIVAKGLAENIGIAKQISTELRTLSYLLHPPLLDELGLESALRWYVDGFAQRSNIKINLELSGGLERVSRTLEIAIFRVVQECLTNIHLHSGSPSAIIRLFQYENSIILEIEDQGKGIPPEKLSKIASSGLPGLGLRGMRERIKDLQGEMGIASQGIGTQIRFVVPFAPAAEQ